MLEPRSEEGAGQGGQPAGAVPPRKQYLELAGEPVLLRALRPFLDHPSVRRVVVVLPAEDAKAPSPWLATLDARVRIVAGGETRAASVRAGLSVLVEEGEELDVLVVHDGARPLATAAMIDRCIRVAAAGRGAVAGWPAVDTIKAVDGRRVVGTPDRATLWHAQTPQAFPRQMLIDAYRRAEEEGADDATDDSALVARYGGEVIMVEGAPGNIKVTRPEDMLVAEALLRIRAGAGGGGGDGP